MGYWKYYFDHCNNSKVQIIELKVHLINRGIVAQGFFYDDGIDLREH